MGVSLRSPEEKLDRLRRLDAFRRWVSLDDKRYCRVCDRVITERQIEVINRGAGILKCPTEGCSSTPKDWICTARTHADHCGKNERIFVTHNGHVSRVRRPKNRLGSQDRFLARQEIVPLKPA